MSNQETEEATSLPPPPPMVYANGFAHTKEGAPAPKGSALRGQIDDYITESSATIEGEGSFDFLKVTPPDSTYVGKTLSFRLTVADAGMVKAEETSTYEPEKTEFGIRLSFDIPDFPPSTKPRGWLSRIIDAILRFFGLKK